MAFSDGRTMGRRRFLVRYIPCRNVRNGLVRSNCRFCTRYLPCVCERRRARISGRKCVNGVPVILQGPESLFLPTADKYAVSLVDEAVVFDGFFYLTVEMVQQVFVCRQRRGGHTRVDLRLQKYSKFKIVLIGSGKKRGKRTCKLRSFPFIIWDRSYQ